MISRVVVITTVALLLAGCGDDSQPTRRIVADQTDQADPHGGTPNPHGGTPNPHGGTPGPHGGTPGTMLPPSATGPEVRLGAMVMTAPDSWQRKQPRSPQITLAEFSLPAAEGDTDGGRLTLSAVSAGVSVDALMNYWRPQFTGTPTEEPRVTTEISGVKVVMVDMSGTFKGQGPKTPAGHAGYRMRLAIFPMGGRQIVVKCVGPKKTINENDEAFMAFLGSLKPPTPPSTTPDPTKPETPATPPATPDATEPDATEPDPPKPPPTEPDATEPDAAEPDATESDATEPDATEPDATEPETP